MKNLLRAFLMTALLCTPVFADGDMGQGGLSGDEGTCPPNEICCPEGQTCLIAGDMGQGGLISDVVNAIYDVIYG